MIEPQYFDCLWMMSEGGHMEGGGANLRRGRSQHIVVRHVHVVHTEVVHLRNVHD